MQVRKVLKIFGPAVSNNITELNSNDQASVRVRCSWLALPVQILLNRLSGFAQVSLISPSRSLNSKTGKPL